MSSRKKSDELDAALRADPNYQDLRALLFKQTERQKRRFSQTFAREDDMGSAGDLDVRITKLRAEGLTYQQVADRLNSEGSRNSKGGDWNKTSVQQRVFQLSKRTGAIPAPAKGGESCEAVQAALTIANTGEAFAQSKSEPLVAKDDEACKPSPVDTEASAVTNLGESFANQEPDMVPAKHCEHCEGMQALEQELYLAIGSEFCEVSHVAEAGRPCEDIEAVEQELLLAIGGEHCEAAKHSEPFATIPDEWLAIIRRVVREELENMQLTQQTQPDTRQLSDHPPTVPRKPGARGLAGERETLPGCRVDKVLYDRFEGQRQDEKISASDLMQKILWLHYDRPTLSFEE